MCNVDYFFLGFKAVVRPFSISLKMDELEEQ
jgi:hypothetical protein